MLHRHSSRCAVRATAALLSLTALCGPNAACSSSTHSWKVYGNARYGYSTCYPADVFHAEPEPDAHDGVLFDGPTDVALSVSGEHSPASNLRGVLDLVVKTLDGRATYTAAGNGWRVASGEAHGKVFYTRVIAGEGVIAQYVIVYPARMRITFAPIVKRLNACMKIG